MKSLRETNEKDLLFIDIETVRAVNDINENTALYEAWEYKNRYFNEQKKKTGEEKNIEDLWKEKASLYAPFGKVVSIVVGRIKDNKITLKPYSNDNEKELLEEFNNDLNKVFEANPKTRFVSFAGVGFDIPFLEKRMIVSGIEPCNLLSESETKPWLLTHIDLMKSWRGNAFYPDSLIAVATALGLPSPKDEMDGSDVGDKYYNGELNAITEYCLKDVETTARVFRKMALREGLEEGYELMGQTEVEEIPILEKILNSKKITQKQVQELQEKATELNEDEKFIALELVKAVFGEKPKSKLRKEVVEIFQ